MSGYLIRVNYQVAGVNKFALLGVDSAFNLPQATAISNAITFVTNYRAERGETITNPIALVSATR